MTPEDFTVEEIERGVMIRCPNDGCDWYQGWVVNVPSLWTLRRAAMEHIIVRHDS